MMSKEIIFVVKHISPLRGVGGPASRQGARRSQRGSCGCKIGKLMKQKSKVANIGFSKSPVLTVVYLNHILHMGVDMAQRSTYYWTSYSQNSAFHPFICLLPFVTCTIDTSEGVPDIKQSYHLFAHSQAWSS